MSSSVHPQGGSSWGARLEPRRLTVDSRCQLAKQLHHLLAELPIRWLQQQGVADDTFASGPVVVGREQQRSLLEAVAAHGGEPALLGLARGVLTAIDEPLVYVLLNVADVAALIDKEQRLNRFFHSHHRVRILELAPTAIELQHESLDRTPPARVESLFVLGLHLVLLEEIGCHGVSATLPGSEAADAVVFRDGLARPQLPPGDAGRWRLTWSGFVARRAWAPGLDSILERASEAPDLGDPVPVEREVRELVGRDLAHRWTVDQVARQLGRSRRALQRSLAGEGTTFSRAVEDARLAEAQRLLADPEQSITAIGFSCGFADTAHFSRRFKARRGCSPSAWRSSEGSQPDT